jgi:hypothetical protein
MVRQEIRDYLPELTFALMKSGAAQSTIKSFRAHWNALPTDTQNLPCPLCFSFGRQGWLQPARFEGERLRSVQCVKCHAHYISGQAAPF